MVAGNFSDSQKTFIIKQGEEGTPVAEICCKAGIMYSMAASRAKALKPRSPTTLRLQRMWRV